MTEEKTKKLLNRFSFFHPEKPITEGLMVFGFEHGDGWFDIIWELCEKIEEDLKQTTKPIGSEIEDFEVIQVKEKFGTLRFYTNWGTNKIYNFIEQAEIKSAKTCEVCGKPGKLRRGGWLKTLCDECQKNS